MGDMRGQIRQLSKNIVGNLVLVVMSNRRRDRIYGCISTFEDAFVRGTSKI